MIGFGFFMLVIIFTVAAHPQSNAAPPVGLFVAFPLLWLAMMGGWVVTLILAIVYGIKASNGEWAEYPVIGRWARRFAR